MSDEELNKRYEVIAINMIYYNYSYIVINS